MNPNYNRGSVGAPSNTSHLNATKAQRTPEVRNFFTIRDGGALKAFFDVLLPIGPDTLEICRCRLIHQDGQPPWVSGPIESWEDEGRRKFRHLVKLPERWKTRILELALREWETPGGAVIGRRSEPVGGQGQ